MRNKSKLRIAGEVVTLINNILITLGIIIGMIYLYLLQSIGRIAVDSFIESGDYYYDNGINLIDKILNYIYTNKILIISIVLTIIALIWVLRLMVINSTSKAMSIVAIILNIGNLIGLVGYALILADNIQLKNNKSSTYIEVDEDMEENHKTNNTLKYSIGVIVAAIVIVPVVFIILKPNTVETSSNNTFDTQQYNNLETNTQLTNVEYIKADYEKKKIDAQEVVTKSHGIQRYNDILIETLNQYDINDIDSAKVVYELSDTLLNNMYQEFKNNMTTETFNELRDEQRIWVSNKEKTETNMKDNELLKYQTFIRMTLDRCKEWNDYY